MKIWKTRIFAILLTLVLFSIGLKVYASTVVTPGDFRLTAESKWDDKKNKNYVQLNWDAVPNLADTGYQLYQSEDSSTWKSISMKYNKPIKVLNVYPDISGSDKLKEWMAGTGENELNFVDSNGTPYIQVDPVKLTDYNANPDAYLKDSATGNYKYDVIMFGTWDAYNGGDLNDLSYQATKIFSNTGRGILFGHDTVYSAKPFFAKFSDELGVSYNLFGIGAPPASWWNGSTQVRLINDGYLMKYPFEMKNGHVLTIPYAHNIEASKKSVGTTWMEFIDSSNEIQDNGTWRSGWYLKTNNNLAMIQTGHSNGASTLDERKIIANTLYNLAQVSLENNAQDYTVKDDVAPEIPDVKLKCGTKDKFSVHITAKDKGKKYQWYVTADTKTDGQKKSDTVEEEVISDIQGYIYTVDNSATTVPTVTKDAYGNVTNINAKVAVPNRTASVYGIDAKANKYMHILAVDRANNVSQVKHIKLDTVDQYIDYEVERTADEAKLVELSLDPVIDKKMQSIEIQIPKNAVIKDYSSLTLPTGWYKYQNSDVNPAVQSFGFSMTSLNNDLTTIQNFLDSLRFTINAPTDQQGNIRIIFHEKIVTSWNSHSDGKTHYYAFIPKRELTWMESYNLAKKQKYKGLTGYLTTFESKEEHEFVYNNIAKLSGWFGGNRSVKNDGTKIMDDSQISEDTGDFITSGSLAQQWYWVNGPEAGKVFFNKPTYSEGGTSPAGMYQGFNNPAAGGTDSEPNNAVYDGQPEVATEFAKFGTNNMYWNDLSLNRTKNGPLADGSYFYREGYYVEFSEYGSQLESEEDTDLCWSSPIPQKISLKGYDEDGGVLSNGDILYDQKLRIGTTITVVPKVIDMYDFKELLNLDNSSHSMTYTVSNSLQEGKLIYTNRKVNIHVRQVAINQNSKIVVPKTGYGTIFSKKTATGKRAQELSVTMGGAEIEGNQTFTEYTVRSKSDEVLYSFEGIIPQYYKLVGYVVTKQTPLIGTSSEHKSTNAVGTFPEVNVQDTPEFWITIYITPTTEQPAFYGWNYGQEKGYQVTK